MNDADATLLTQFVRYGRKRFNLGLLLSGLVCGRARPEIPARPVVLSLVLGEVAHVPSLLQLQEETKLPEWQRWVGYPGAISDDTFGYVSERLDPEHLRRAARYLHCKLKRGKAFEANKLNGLLCVSLDANEQFCSDHRSCEQCLTREVKYKDARAAILEHGLQLPLGQGVLFFERAVILRVTFRLPGVWTKLRLQPHVGGSVGAPSASRFF